MANRIEYLFDELLEAEEDNKLSIYRCDNKTDYTLLYFDADTTSIKQVEKLSAYISTKYNIDNKFVYITDEKIVISLLIPYTDIAEHKVNRIMFTTKPRNWTSVTNHTNGIWQIGDANEDQD